MNTQSPLKYFNSLQTLRASRLIKHEDECFILYLIEFFIMNPILSDLAICVD